MNHKEMIEKCLGDLPGTGARIHRKGLFGEFELVSINAGVDTVGIPWDEIKHLYKGDPNNITRTDCNNMSDIDDGTKHRWVSTVPIKGNDVKYGRVMFCLKTGIIRNTTFDEFYGGGIVD